MHFTPLSPPLSLMFYKTAKPSFRPSTPRPYTNTTIGKLNIFNCVQRLIPLADRDLFNAAFLSCWSELSEDQQDELIRSIELALTSQDIAEVTQTLLNLAEFMEHSDKVGGSTRGGT